MSQQQGKHWVDKIADGILKWQEKTAVKKLHVDDMKTPSGRVHVGSLRGVILHDVVAKALEQKTDQKITSTYVFNDMDAMDGFPAYLPDSFRKYMGHPLHKIPAPTLEESGIDFNETKTEHIEKYQHAGSMAEFYALDFLDAFQKLGCSQEIVWSHELYESGNMDSVIRESLDAVEIFKAIYKEVADYKLPENWYPFQVFCENCGQSGSTLVTDWDGEKVTYECQRSKVDWAIGCEHTGKISPFGGTGKLLWKADWPGHWKVLGVTIEGAGKDHTSEGGSRDMANEICQKILNIQTPFDIPYEWILLRGTKMSSSKGIGTSAREFVELFPAEIGRFLFVNKHYNQVIDFDPTTMAIPDLFDEYDLAARIFWKEEAGDQRMARSFELSQIGAQMPAAKFLPRFRDIAKWMQHPELNLVEEFEKIKGEALTPEELEELKIRKQYANLWVKRYAPAEYQLTAQAELPVGAQELTGDQKEFLVTALELTASKAWNDPQELQQALFEKSKEEIGPRKAFQAIYLAFLGQTAGPRAAWFLLSLDQEIIETRKKQLGL